jgi:hypothetical protein
VLRIWEHEPTTAAVRRVVECIAGLRAQSRSGAAESRPRSPSERPEQGRRG